MAKLSKDLAAGTLHPRETLFASGSLSSLGAELIVAADGAASVSLDVRGTSSLMLEVAGTVDGINWIPIPVRPIGQTTISYMLNTYAGFAGILIGKCSAFRQVRVRVISYVSGLAQVTLAADTAPLDDDVLSTMTTGVMTIVGAAGAAVTLSVPAPGNGMRNFITYVSINRFAAAALTASATPVTGTSTNLPGNPAFTLPADAAAQGSMITQREEFNPPLPSVSQGSSTTIILPATPNVIWRASAGYYAAP